MRPPHRSPMPDLELLLKESNKLLARNALPQCQSIVPVFDGDTANPNAILFAHSHKFVVKVNQRHSNTLPQQLEVANRVRNATNLPIPKHYCCSIEGSTFPLMIMEWLPGEQIRTVLPVAENANLRKLCASLAECLVEFHNPNLLDVVPKSRTESDLPSWLYKRSADTLKRCGENGTVDSLSEQELSSIRRYLRARLEVSKHPALPSLEKADLDLRDFLVNPTKFEITGMLDWERVTNGDATYAIALVFLRLWLNDKLIGWKEFIETYNQLSKVAVVPCPQIEFYLMCRAVIAYEANRSVKELIQQLLEGTHLPLKS